MTPERIKSELFARENNEPIREMSGAAVVRIANDYAKIKADCIKQNKTSMKKKEVGVWVKASELKDIDYPICIRYDGGGAYYYTTVCSMEELYKHVDSVNPIEEIEYLKPVSQIDLLNEKKKEYCIAFAKFLNDKGWQEYDESDRWIRPTASLTVYTTSQVYDFFIKKGD